MQAKQVQQILDSNKGKKVSINYKYSAENGYRTSYEEGTVESVDESIVVLKRDKMSTHFDYTTFNVYSVDIKE